jgi:uncharacterized protein (DUF1800 family)
LARHLVRRFCFGAPPELVEKAYEMGPASFVRAQLSSPPPDWEVPYLDIVRSGTRELQLEIRAAADDVARQELRNLENQRDRRALLEAQIQWLHRARQPNEAARENWVSFLSNVFVISTNRVRNSVWVNQYFETLRMKGVESLESLAFAVFEEPAMLEYLDTQRSNQRHPNENFPRELFELFLLGEGQYTESDVLEAARAFTGYRHSYGQFGLDQRQHDQSEKTVFGETGNFDAYDVIRLTLRQPGAETFFPMQLARHYLSDNLLPRELFEPLGRAWARRNYDFLWLAETFFSSGLFYQERFVGNLIKSPLRFYLGLLSDLDLQIMPWPGESLNRLRQMGQPVWTPPNVRGWVGGPAWINSSTLNGRRIFAQRVFQRVNEDDLNADDLERLIFYRERSEGPLFFQPGQIMSLSRGKSPRRLGEDLIERWLAHPASKRWIPLLEKQLGLSDEPPADRVRTALTALFQSPDYQLI